MPALKNLFEELRPELMAGGQRVPVMVQAGKNIADTEKVKAKCPKAGHVEEQEGVQVAQWTIDETGEGRATSHRSCRQ